MAGSENHHTLERPKFETPLKLLVVRAPYYKDIADNLLTGAIQEIEAAGGNWDLVDRKSVV